ncbi:MAG: GNAT family N-acetyltransferase, partial [Streptosporangiaceae bacterium]
MRRRAFGPVSDAGRAAWGNSVLASIEAGTTLGAFDGGRLVGSARYHVMRQWWHGRSMPMAGVAGVKVAPEQRGRGVGTAMMARLLTDIADRGYPLSALYPATAPLYRGFGWEIAGGRYETVVPPRSLAALIEPDTAATTAVPGGAAGLRRASRDDGPAIVAVKGLVHAALRHCGPNTRDPREIRDWLDDHDHFGYLADDGFLSYRWARGTDELAVEELIAASAATARAFWQILASHATMADRVRACLAPDDAVRWLTREPDAQARRATAWMLRIVDAQAAIESRGFPAGVTLSVLVEIADPVRPANSGSWRLHVAGGRGSLQRADAEPGARPAAAPVRLGARGVAALFGG